MMSITQYYKFLQQPYYVQALGTVDRHKMITHTPRKQIKQYIEISICTGIVICIVNVQ